MEDPVEEEGPSRKRIKLGECRDIETNISTPLTSLETPITPPQRKARPRSQTLDGPQSPKQNLQVKSTKAFVSSPFHLTRIRDLPSTLNTDTVTLKDLLDDPLIYECWEFNYLHDVDFLMESFDPDVRELVKVHVVHGFWKDEDGRGLKMQASKYSNVTLHTAYMPEMFGTHHTKMMVLLRHDDIAQIIVHTANLIRRDWANLCQAVWRSPLLPLASSTASLPIENPPMGSGARFKFDFLNYLRAYDTRRTVCKPLVEQLEKYDFSEVRGALIGSVPGRHVSESETETKWGWRCLRHVLSSVPVRRDGSPEVVVQISSIATLGQTNHWLVETLFKSLSQSKWTDSPSPKFKIIFPTPDEIRKSLDGYESGASIHTKIQTPAQAKQLQYLKPMLHHWAGDASNLSADFVAEQGPGIRDAGRRRAAPHIKTYVRFQDASMTEIDWALVTSANMSKQAWGEASNPQGEMRISSYELGVLVWPELFGEDAKMVPTFKQDVPKEELEDVGTKVAFRMPYDTPLVQYTRGELPWCASARHSEPDWRGFTWP